MLDTDIKNTLKLAFAIALTGIICFYITTWLTLPQGYWAVISGIFVTYSKMDKTLSASKDRLAGTAIGALVGAVFYASLGDHILIFASAILVAVIICAWLRLADSHRLASVTIAIIFFAHQLDSSWLTAFYRFIEVSLGIVVALLVATLFYSKKNVNNASPQ